jgi:hypothetical protein
MTVTIRNIIPSKIAENTQTTQYTAGGVTTIIDKFTATNYSAAIVNISVNLVTVTGSAGDNNLIVKQKTLQPSETYTFPELVGHVLSNGSFISTLASASASINIRASGREVS